MAKPTVADYLLTRLREWGTEYVFAYAGDGINGILAAWGRAGNKPRFIQARHEEASAFMAVTQASAIPERALTACCSTSRIRPRDLLPSPLEPPLARSGFQGLRVGP